MLDPILIYRNIELHNKWMDKSFYRFENHQIMIHILLKITFLNNEEDIEHL